MRYSAAVFKRIVFARGEIVLQKCTRPTQNIDGPCLQSPGIGIFVGPVLVCVGVQYTSSGFLGTTDCIDFLCCAVRSLQL